MTNYFATATPIEGGGGFNVAIDAPGYSANIVSPDNEHLIVLIKDSIHAETGEQLDKIGVTLGYKVKKDVE